VVWRCAAWHPNLISHLFAICTPYAAPSKQYISTEQMVNGPIPQFGYQLQLASGEVEPRINTEAGIRQFLNGMYGGRGPKGEVMFSPRTGVIFENLSKVGKSPLMSDRVRISMFPKVPWSCSSLCADTENQEMNWYVQEYSRNGLHGPCKFYASILTKKTNCGRSELVQDAQGELGG